MRNPYLHKHAEQHKSPNVHLDDRFTRSNPAVHTAVSDSAAYRSGSVLKSVVLSELETRNRIVWIPTRRIIGKTIIHVHRRQFHVPVRHSDSEVS